MAKTTLEYTKIETRESKKSNLIIKNLVKEFKRHGEKGYFTAVNNISYEFEEGELTTLLGPSGCGKTTMLRMIAGFETPTSGSIFIGDKNITNTPPNVRDISMVFQSYALFPHLNIFENIAYGLKIKKIDSSRIKERVMNVISLMQLGGMENRYPNQISGGQQQRVALARAIVIEPKLLLFDEPLSNLDAKLREYMRDEIRKLQLRLGITSIYVTHDQSEAMAISDKVIIMNQGNIEQIGSPQEIYYKPANRFVANFMGKANFVEAVILSNDGNTAVVKIGDNPIKASLPENSTLKLHDKCTLMIRPEAVKLVESSGNISGTVKQVVFLGAIVEYTIDINGCDIIVQMANPQNKGIMQSGEKIGIVFDESCTRILCNR